MPRRLHSHSADVIFHVWNRGARRLQIFRDSVDYTEFLATLRQAQERTKARVLAYLLMPTHFHLVLWPRTNDELARFMRWLLATHSKRWHARHQTNGTGPVYQGPYGSKPITSPRHFLTVCRYVETNALARGLVTRAEEWPWSSLSQRCRNLNTVTLEPWPILQPENWLFLVNETTSPTSGVDRG